MKAFEPGVSVVLVARNEERRLPTWFEHVVWADELIVVDSGSTDRTAEIAKAYTDKVFSVPNKLNFDINKNFGFEQAKREWIFSLDADEWPADDLIEEIQSVIRDPKCPYAGFEIPFQTFMLGHEIRMFSVHLLRLFRNAKGNFPEQSVHQRIRIQGAVGRLSGKVIHYTDESVSERVQKSDLYSECMAASWYEMDKPFRLRELILHPLYLFFRKFFLSGGFRDGIPGLITVVNGAYSDFLRYAKLWSAYEQGYFLSPTDDYPPDQRKDRVPSGYCDFQGRKDS